MPGADYDAVTADDGALLHWLRLLRDGGVAVLRGTPREPLSVLALAGLIGPARATNFGEHFDVVSKPAPNSNAYTALGLLCHTDLPNWERPPDYQLLHCLENEADGGDSILVDGFRAAEELRRREPAAYRLLTRFPIDFRFQDDDSDIRFRAPTIALDGNRDLSDLVFLQELYDHGGGDCFDVLSAQGYGLRSGPTDRRLRATSVNIGRHSYYRDIMVRNGDARKPIWLSEAA
jgi:gamma-butyrobetaine dioxygenase